jgi:sugar-specific transcriptional regulator TrmB
VDNPKLIKHLEQIGFTNKSAIVYAYLLETGGDFPAQIAEKTKLNRTTVYKILLDLVQEKLINEIEKAKKLYYQISNPESLLKYTKSSIQQATDRHESAERLLPRLLDFFSSPDDRPKLTFLGGPKALTDLQTIITNENSGHEILTFSNPSLFSKYLTEEVQKEYIRNKEKAGLQTKEIMPDNEANRAYYDQAFIMAKKQYTPKVRFIQAYKYDFGATITLFGLNKIAIMKTTPTNLSGLIIEDEKIHQTFKNIFELCWQQAVD